MNPSSFRMTMTKVSKQQENGVTSFYYKERNIKTYVKFKMSVEFISWQIASQM